MRGYMYCFAYFPLDFPTILGFLLRMNESVTLHTFSGDVGTDIGASFHTQFSALEFWWSDFCLMAAEVVRSPYQAADGGHGDGGVWRQGSVETGHQGDVARGCCLQYHVRTTSSWRKSWLCESMQLSSNLIIPSCLHLHLSLDWLDQGACRPWAQTKSTPWATDSELLCLRVLSHFEVTNQSFHGQRPCLLFCVCCHHETSASTNLFCMTISNLFCRQKEFFLYCLLTKFWLNFWNKVLGTSAKSGCDFFSPQFCLMPAVLRKTKTKERHLGSRKGIGNSGEKESGGGKAFAIIQLAKEFVHCLAAGLSGGYKQAIHHSRPLYINNNSNRTKDCGLCCVMQCSTEYQPNPVLLNQYHGARHECKVFSGAFCSVKL